MDEETSTIKQHIAAEREQLGRNLDEIEHRVKKATDFKTYFNQHTGWILGAAVAGGVLLSRAFPTAPSADTDWGREIGQGQPTSIQPARPWRSHLSRLSETLDDVFDGLVAVVSDQIHGFVSDAVPGFRERYDGIERERKRA